MKFVFYTNNISPHQLPLAHEVARIVGYDNFTYVGEEIAWRGTVVDRTRDGHEIAARTVADDGVRDLLETCDVLYVGGVRPIELIERRARAGRTTLYVSERWFKPIPLSGMKVEGWRLKVEGGMWHLPGWVRMFVPGYRRLAKRFVKVANDYACVKFLAIGPWAKRDFLRIGVQAERIVDWGYFVAPSARELVGEVSGSGRVEGACVTKVLWVGRMVGWKRADTIVRAVDLANDRLCAQGSEALIDLTLVGSGEEEARIKRLISAARHASHLTLRPSVPLEAVRQLMREHDVYVLASDANEGWGAVVSEAMEEGMCVLGTHEAGASATLLPADHLFSAGNVRELAELLLRWRSLSPNSIGEWSAAGAARRLIGLVEGNGR